MYFHLLPLILILNRNFTNGDIQLDQNFNINEGGGGGDGEYSSSLFTVLTACR